MRSLRIHKIIGSLGAALIAAAIAVACRSATEVVVEVAVEFPCDHLQGVAITVGELGEALEGMAPTTTSTTCARGTGRVGSVVVIPSGKSDDLLGIKVVAGYDRDVRGCDPKTYAGCIVARRALRYIPHQRLTVPIALGTPCVGVACNAHSTCVDGTCQEATIPDSNACAGPSGCTDDTLFPDASSLSVDAGSDAASDATSPSDAGLIEASAPDASLDASDASPFGDPSIACGSSSGHCVASVDRCCNVNDLVPDFCYGGPGDPDSICDTDGGYRTSIECDDRFDCDHWGKPGSVCCAKNRSYNDAGKWWQWTTVACVPAAQCNPATDELFCQPNVPGACPAGTTCSVTFDQTPYRGCK